MATITLELRDGLTATVNWYRTNCGVDIYDADAKEVGESYAHYIGYDCLPDIIYAAINAALPDGVEIDYLWDIILSDETFNGDCGCIPGDGGHNDNEDRE